MSWVVRTNHLSVTVDKLGPLDNRAPYPKRLLTYVPITGFCFFYGGNSSRFV